MKPRAFIGSSVEGLPVAYAVQQNLLHDAEITVWSQGVFELSATTLESLDSALGATDFGIFVFSADDLSVLRSQQVSTIRDNVLFEFGLFIGRIGRDRVFFLLPDNAPSLHIPTDLLGVTPGKYEVGRTDGNMQSATGPASHQIRTQIQKLGLHPRRISPPNAPSIAAMPEQANRHWIFDFYEEKYAEAKLQIQHELEMATGDDAIEKHVWAIRCDLKLNVQQGLKSFQEYADLHVGSVVAICAVASALMQENYTDKALTLLNRIDQNLVADPRIQVVIAECHLANQDLEVALEALDAHSTNPQVAIKRSEILEKQGMLNEALECVHRSFIEHPNHEGNRYRFAQLASALDKNDIAAYLFDGLTRDFHKNETYWGYLGNTCLKLGFEDHALVSYRRAEMANGQANPPQWILANIGNVLNNRELPSEAKKYLELAVKQGPSDYAYERLASAMKNADAQLKEFQKKTADGLKQIRGMKVSVDVPAS